MIVPRGRCPFLHVHDMHDSSSANLTSQDFRDCLERHSRLLDDLDRGADPVAIAMSASGSHLVRSSCWDGSVPERREAPEYEYDRCAVDSCCTETPLAPV